MPILSHRWEDDGQEVTFEDMAQGSGQDKAGYYKIKFCGEQAASDGLQYFWVGSCCIDKSKDGEHQKAINSMFRWCRNAIRCYVYLSDVSVSPIDRKGEYNPPSWELDFQKSKWFTRGWTLQELLAPASVEFFSRNRKRLGDKGSLEQQIHRITGIDTRALQGEPLTQFSVKDRFSWIERRETTFEEDKAYSMLGIFDIGIPLRYGEGMASAFKRLEDEIDGQKKKCIQDLRITDPRDDKKRIEDTKGGLLEGSYRWILENSDFQQWRNDQQSRLLWIKGDPGKGKTMLMCGIIEKLQKCIGGSDLVSFFFCQATDLRINSATAVLRGLIYLLADQQPSLISHIRKKYDFSGSQLFEDVNAWVAVSEILNKMLKDPSLQSAYLIVDALDECDIDLPKLLDFIVQNSMTSRVKWVVSSRNIPEIEQRLRLDQSLGKLSLELRKNAEQVSLAVDEYIKHCVSNLPNIHNDEDLQIRMLKGMQRKAEGTFLWVSLVIKELKEAESWDVEQIVDEMPPGLRAMYDRMLRRIQQLKRENPKLCRLVLSTAIAAYRPLRLEELRVLSGLPKQILDGPQPIARIVSLCGSFLTIQEQVVYVIHQSAKDFLSSKEFRLDEIRQIHYKMFSLSLIVLSQKLRKDIYILKHPGFPINQVEQPKPDPLADVRYSCIYWADHLYDCDPAKNATDDLSDSGSVNQFLHRSFLYWLEALSLLRSMSGGILSMAKLDSLLHGSRTQLADLARDGYRFIQYHKWAIENSPLQVYISALIFSPTHSLIRRSFKHEEPNWITTKPTVEDNWNACLQTLEGHSDRVISVVFSHDSKLLASASYNRTVTIWDASTGTLQQTLEGHSDGVISVVFSHDSKLLASASYDCTVKIWNASTGTLQQTLKGHSDRVISVVFSHDSKLLASASYDCTIKIWDASTGTVRQTLEGHSSGVISVVFSHDSKLLAPASYDYTVKIWDTSTSTLQQTLRGHSIGIKSVVFSHDSKLLASASYDCIVKIWDASTGTVQQTLKGHSSGIILIVFSHDSKLLAFGVS